MTSEYYESWEEQYHPVALGIVQMPDRKQDFIMLISIVIAQLKFLKFSLIQVQNHFEIQYKKLSLQLAPQAVLGRSPGFRVPTIESPRCLAFNQGQESTGDSMSDSENYIWLASVANLKLDFLTGFAIKLFLISKSLNKNVSGQQQ